MICIMLLSSSMTAFAEEDAYQLPGESTVVEVDHVGMNQNTIINPVASLQINNYYEAF